MTRTDAMLDAIVAMLEHYRPLLDGQATIRSVRLDIKFSETEVRTTLFTPEIETPQKRQIGNYVFKNG